MTVKPMKIVTPLLYQQYAVAIPQDLSRRVQFPIEMLGEEGCVPLREKDSGIIESNLRKPVLLTKYSALASANNNWCKHCDSWITFGWDIMPIGEPDVHRNLNNIEPEKIHDVLNRQSLFAMIPPAPIQLPPLQGTKLNEKLKYIHAAIAKPVYKYSSFPTDMLRYDRAFLFDPEDTKVDGPIRFMKHQENSKPSWRVDRWRSFGWTLEPASYIDWIT